MPQRLSVQQQERGAGSDGFGSFEKLSSDAAWSWFLLHVSINVTKKEVNVQGLISKNGHYGAKI